MHEFTVIMVLFVQIICRWLFGRDRRKDYQTENGQPQYQPHDAGETDYFV